MCLRGCASERRKRHDPTERERLGQEIQTALDEKTNARGINLLMIWASKGTSAELQRTEARIGYGAPERWPWSGPPDRRSFDLCQFNPAYVPRLRKLAALADRRDSVRLADDKREMPERFDARWDWRQENQYFQARFGAPLIAELAGYSNVTYEMFNEGEWYDRTKLPFWETPADPYGLART